jgi:protoporphyrinogen oxidase
MAPSKDNVHIIGADPAGMACAYTLARGGHAALLIEREKYVGGLCQTIGFSGYLFDIGGHRFLSNTFWSQGPQQEYLEM